MSIKWTDLKCRAKQCFSFACWPLWTMGGLFLLLISVPFVFGPWAWGSVIMILAGIGATQIGAKYREILQKALVRACASQEQGLEPVNPSISNEEKTKLEELKEAIKNRANPPHKDAQEALDSFLNQAVGTWSMVVLIIGIIATLAIRTSIGIEVASWVSRIIVFLAVGALGLFIWFTMYGGGTELSSLFVYYGHKKRWPPSGKLTLFRVLVLVAYSILVFAVNWPTTPANSTLNPAQHDSHLSKLSAANIDANTITNLVGMTNYNSGPSGNK